MSNFLACCPYKLILFGLVCSPHGMYNDIARSVNVYVTPSGNDDALFIRYLRMFHIRGARTESILIRIHSGVCSHEVWATFWFGEQMLTLIFFFANSQNLMLNGLKIKSSQNILIIITRFPFNHKIKIMLGLAWSTTLKSLLNWCHGVKSHIIFWFLFWKHF